MSATESTQRFMEPSARDLLAEFVKKFRPNGSGQDDWSFEPFLYRLISAFKNESIVPFQKILTDAMVITAGKIRIETELELARNAHEWVELWRGQFHGDWFRLIAVECFRKLQLQRAHAEGREDCESWSWSVEWMQ